jgi:hypothetical protein
MAIEWRQKPREYSKDSIDCLAVADAPEGTEIVADYGPVFGDRIAYMVAWRRKMTAGEAVTSQPTAQLAVEGYAPTPQVAKATCERLMQSLQQIAHDSPGMLQTLHSAAT